MRSWRIGAAWQCERAREWISLELDGELSAFELQLVHRHVRRCADCREYAHDLRAIAGLLRAAPLEQPSHAVHLPLRRRRNLGAVGRGAFASAAAAAAAAAVAVGIGLQSDVSTGNSGQTLSSRGEIQGMLQIRQQQLRPLASSVHRRIRVIEID